MVLFIIIGAVVLIAFVVLGVLFFMLSKEGAKKEEEAVPLTDLNQLKKEFSSSLLEPQEPRLSKLESEIIPPFEPKVPLPINNAPLPSSILEDNEYKIRAKELEEELQAINLKAEGQSQEAKQMIEVLTKENESLKGQQADLEQAKLKLLDLQGEASNLKTDNVNLQAQLESANARVALLEEQMSAFKIQMGEEISRANATVTELAHEKETLLSTPQAAEPDPSLVQALESLRSEYLQLKQKYEDLQKAQEQLQYELVKARAQSSGLERVSFNYKNQLEDFLKNINTVQASNEQLSQAKNRLEGLVEEVKSQNEELMKRDQLAQFELEKNRSRLISLERECEDLKARAQQEKG